MDRGTLKKNLKVKTLTEIGGGEVRWSLNFFIRKEEEKISAFFGPMGGGQLRRLNFLNMKNKVCLNQQVIAQNGF